MAPTRRVGVLELVTHAPTAALVSNVLGPNLAGIMPQVISVWAERAGHDVSYLCYTGKQKLPEQIPSEVDVLFVSAFTQSAQLAYAVAYWARSKGITTILGGPHARCYPDDAAQHFDYVVGLCNEQMIADLIADASPQHPAGVRIAAAEQLHALPSVRERWPYLSTVIKDAPSYFRVIPMIGSVGCPYTCSFCIDATVDYEALDVDTIKADLRFIKEKMPLPVVAWHDPNFGVRFKEIMAALEEADPEGKINHVAESSLALLGEDRVERMGKAGFKAILPGVESWYDMGLKAKTGRNQGMAKVEKVADHLNRITKHIPYIQANFVLGLDMDAGAEPFELTKTFVDLAPSVFPGYSLLQAFGAASPLNAGLSREDRVLPFPFHFLNNNLAMNVKPKNYDWAEFYDRLIDLNAHTWSWKNLARRFATNRTFTVRWVNLARGISAEGFGRWKHHKNIRRLLDEDPDMLPYFNGESDKLPAYYENKLRDDLGALYAFLPAHARQRAPIDFAQPAAAK